MSAAQQRHVHADIYSVAQKVSTIRHCESKTCQ